MGQHKDAWDEHQIPVGQVDAVLAQLMLLHMCMPFMVDPEFVGDEAKEEVRAVDMML